MTNAMILMIYFPLVIVGLGQALIVGMNAAGRVLHDADKSKVRGTIHAKFNEDGHAHCDVDDKRETAHLPQLRRRPVASLSRF